MALDIKTLRKEPKDGLYVSDKRLCLTEDGKVVAGDDPKAATLLVGEGSVIPAEVAARYGLIGEPDEQKGKSDERQAESDTTTGPEQSTEKAAKAEATAEEPKPESRQRKK